MQPVITEFIFINPCYPLKLFREQGLTERNSAKQVPIRTNPNFHNLCRELIEGLARSLSIPTSHILYIFLMYASFLSGKRSLFLQAVMTLPENKTIIHALHDGDKDLFSRLYDHYSSSLYQNIYKLLPNATEAEDVLQNVFLTLWEKRTSLTEEQSVAGWLFTTSFYITMATLRQKVKNRIEVLQEYMTDIKDAATNEEEIYQVRSGFLSQAISQLPERKRQAFELCKIEGRSYKETATILGITEDTVREYVKSAITILKRIAATTDLSFYTILVLFLS